MINIPSISTRTYDYLVLSLCIKFINEQDDQTTIVFFKQAMGIQKCIKVGNLSEGDRYIEKPPVVMYTISGPWSSHSTLVNMVPTGNRFNFKGAKGVFLH